MSNPSSNPNPYQYLGCDVTGITDVDAMLSKGGADFRARLAPVTFQADGETYEDPANQVLYRDDTMEPIAVHGAGYQVVQYDDVLSSALSALEVAKVDGEVQTCGVMNDGGQFYASIRVGEFTIDPGGVADLVQTHLNLVSSHDGTLALMYAFGAFRMICANEAPALGKSKFRVAAKHTLNVQERKTVGLKAFSVAQEATQEFQGHALALQAKPSSDRTFKTTVERFFGKLGDLSEGRGRTRRENTHDRLMALYRGDRCVGAVGNTRWAEFNAITEYLDHGRLQGGDDPQGKMAATTITPDSWVDKRKREVGAYLLSR